EILLAGDDGAVRLLQQEIDVEAEAEAAVAIVAPRVAGRLGIDEDRLADPEGGVRALLVDAERARLRGEQRAPEHERRGVPRIDHRRFGRDDRVQILRTGRARRAGQDERGGQRRKQSLHANVLPYAEKG